MRDRLRLTFPHDRVPEPVVCQMARAFEVVFSIRRASVEPSGGWIDLSLEGDEDEIERAIEWLEGRGVGVGPVGGDIVEG